MNTKFIHLRAREQAIVGNGVQLVTKANGGATIAYRFEDDTLVITGVICSDKDLYNRKEGRIKAEERLKDDGLTARLKFKPLFAEMLLDGMQAQTTNYLSKIFGVEAGEKATAALSTAVVEINNLLDNPDNLDSQTVTKLVESIFIKNVANGLIETLNARSAAARVEADARRRSAAQLRRQERHAIRMQSSAERKAQYVTAEA